MKLLRAFASTCTLLSLLSQGLAQELPTCAKTCLGTSLQAQATCSLTDTRCICTNEEIMSAVQVCVLSTCSVKEALTAQNATQTMCGQPKRDISHISPIISGVSGGAALISVIIRSMSTGGNFQASDIMAVAAIVTAIPVGALQFFLAADGFGRDIWTIPHEKIYRIGKLLWIAEMIYSIAVELPKISFLFFCLRIFPQHGVRNTLYVLVGLCTAHGIAFTFIAMLNCTPIPYIWNGWDGEHSGKCINFHACAWVQAVTNIALDLAMLSVPIPPLLKLHLSTKKKIYIIMMFSIGTFTTIIAIIRLQALVQFSNSKNPTYDNVSTFYWSVLELFTGIFCVCMPALRKFLQRFFPRFFSSTQGNSHYRKYDTPDGLNNPSSSGAGAGLKRTKASVPDKNIAKTMETKIESRLAEDDEIQLVQLQQGNMGGWVSDPSDKGSNGSRNGTQTNLDTGRWQ